MLKLLKDNTRQYQVNLQQLQDPSDDLKVETEFYN